MDKQSLWPQISWFSPVVILPCVWMAGMVLSDRFRHVSDGIFGHYVLHLARDLIRYGWTFALIYVLHLALQSGSLVNAIGAAKIALAH